MMIRNYGGGYHANNHIACIVTTIAIFCVLLELNKLSLGLQQFLGLAGLILGTLIIWINGPVDNINKPLSKKEKQNLAKRLYVVLGISNTLGLVLLLFQNTILYGFVIAYVLMVMSVGGIIGRIKNEKLTIKNTKNDIKTTKNTKSIDIIL